MGDKNPWGTPSKVYFSDKPLLEGTTDLQSVDWNELDLNNVSEFNCEVENVVDEAIDNARFVADSSSHSITVEVKITPKQMRRLFPKPRLPRKKKKALKKLVLPYAEYLYSQGLAGRKQQFVTVGWYRIWIKVNRNKLKR